MRTMKLASLMLPFLLASCLTLEVTEGEAAGTITGYGEDGTAITDISSEVMTASGFALGDTITITSGEYTVTVPLCGRAEDADPSSPLAILGDGTLQIMVRDGSFRSVSSLEEGSAITVTLAESGGYLEEYSRRNLLRIEDRSFYETDESFADFRAVIPGILYRSSSPIEGDARSLAADALTGEAGIMTIINLEDTEEEMAMKSPSGVSYSRIAEEGRAIALGGLDEEAKEREMLRAIAENPAPYLIHDRDGHTTVARMAAYLGALSGMNIKLLTQDYMQTFVSSSGVIPGSDQYQEKSGDILSFLISLNGRPFPWSMLQQAVRQHAISRLGLSEAEADAVILRLTQ